MFSPLTVGVVLQVGEKKTLETQLRIPRACKLLLLLVIIIKVSLDTY